MSDVASEPLDAGPLGEWLAQAERSLTDATDATVPCGDCTACCRSSQFVHVGPDETETLERIPPGLLFPAPRSPAGHVLMGYDAAGRCPMLGEHGCTIYEHRPRTCRVYDCRIFAATGVEVEPDDKPLIAARSRRWRFDLSAPEDIRLAEALRAAAEHHRASVASATQLAVRAVETYREHMRG